MEITDELYIQYASTIDRMVNHYARAFNFIDTDELTLQAGLIFCEAARSFDPDHKSGASFKTYLENQLKALSHVVDRALHGPTLLVGSGESPMSLDQCMVDPNDGTHGGDGMSPVADHVKSDYGKSLEQDDESDLPTALRAYVEMLTGDSRTILEDILGGELDPNLKTMEHLSRSEQVKERTLSAWKVYKKRYIKMGWDWPRTRTAWNELKSMISLYRTDRLPCRLVRG